MVHGTGRSVTWQVEATDAHVSQEDSVWSEKHYVTTAQLLQLLLAAAGDLAAAL
jgi:hypothetical protein